MSQTWQCTFPGCTYVSIVKQAVDGHYLTYHQETVRAEMRAMSSRWARPLSPTSSTGGAESTRTSTATPYSGHANYSHSPSPSFSSYYSPSVSEPSSSYYSAELHRGSITTPRRDSAQPSPNVGFAYEENAAYQRGHGVPAYSRLTSPAEQTRSPFRALSASTAPSGGHRDTTPPRSPELDRASFEGYRRGSDPYTPRSGTGGPLDPSQVLPPVSVQGGAREEHSDPIQGPSGSGIHPDTAAFPDTDVAPTPLVPYDLLAAHGFFDQGSYGTSRYNSRNNGRGSRATERRGPYHRQRD
ncbi:hypothetical protein C8Q78DRAFT_844454 [Trametes maxima]|nr:hypothetical protein C8Q78DRAFT_844454 [Trametes maxima]